MSTQVLLYWITRLDSIHKVVTVGLVLAAVLCVTGGFFWVISRSDYDDDDMCETYSRICKKSAFALFFFIAANIFIPTTRDAMIIAGVGGIAEYLKSNETATRLPDKAIKVLDKFFDEYVGESYQFPQSADPESI